MLQKSLVKALFYLSWEETQWNLTGNVESGSVDVELELCARLDIELDKLIKRVRV